MTTEVCSTIVWLMDHADDLILEAEGWSRDVLSYTCGDGGSVVAFTRHRDGWILDHVSGESVEMLLSEEMSDLSSRLDADAGTPTVYYSCDPDCPSNFVASFAKHEATTLGSFGHIPADETTIDVTDADSIQDTIYAAVGPTVGSEMLCACWSLAYYIAISDLFIDRKDFTSGWDAFAPDDFCTSSDRPRHAELFCDMVGIAFGPEAEEAQREALAAHLAEGDE